MHKRISMLSKTLKRNYTKNSNSTSCNSKNTWSSIWMCNQFFQSFHTYSWPYCLRLWIKLVMQVAIYNVSITYHAFFSTMEGTSRSYFLKIRVCTVLALLRVYCKNENYSFAFIRICTADSSLQLKAKLNCREKIEALFGWRFSQDVI